MTTELTLIPLRCDACGQGLDGLAGDLVFSCTGCRQAMVLEGEALREVPVRFVKPAYEKTKGTHLHLPFWGFRVSFRWKGGSATQQRAAACIDIDWVYVMGFSMEGIAYFGDLGLLYTKQRIGRESGSSDLLVGGTRSEAEARCYIEPFILSILDAREDITGIEVACEVEETMLLGIPFFDCGDHLVDGIAGQHVPAAALPDLEEIRGYRLNSPPTPPPPGHPRA